MFVNGAFPTFSDNNYISSILTDGDYVDHPQPFSTSFGDLGGNEVMGGESFDEYDAMSQGLGEFGGSLGYNLYEWWNKDKKSGSDNGQTLDFQLNDTTQSMTPSQYWGGLT